MEALILVATLGGPTMFARIGVMRALNGGHVREFDISRKDHHWGKRKLARGAVMDVRSRHRDAYPATRPNRSAGGPRFVRFNTDSFMP